jgi:hypothetical protein
MIYIFLQRVAGSLLAIMVYTGITLQLVKFTYVYKPHI